MSNSSVSSSRKFVDLIFKATAKWANLNPPTDIKVGDYGKLDETTGEFLREGNIYNDSHNIFLQDQNIAQLVKDHPPITATREDEYIAASTRVKRGDFKLGAEVSAIPGLADASIKGQWIFGSRRGALLIMAHPRCSYIPPATILKYLAEVEGLKDMFLVTEVFSCPAYSLYLSSGTNEIVNLALLGSSPLPQAPVSLQIAGKWWVQNTSGLFRSASEPDGKDDYTPLYMLKGIRKKRGIFSRRDRPPPEREGDDLWEIVQVPWSPLDENGDEEAFEDAVHD